AFLREVCDNPLDDAPRLIFADWLEERGDVRGEFIRLQCDLESMMEHHPRRGKAKWKVNQLIKKHGKTWASNLPSAVRAYDFRRGFVEHVCVAAATMVKQAEELFALTPARSLRLTHLKGKASLVAKSDWLDRITELDFNKMDCKIKEFGPLLASPRLTNLQELNFDRFKGLGSSQSALTQLIAETPHLASLRKFHAYDAGVSNQKAIQLLADSPYLRSLESLSLRANKFGDAGGEPLAQSEILTSIRELDLSRTGIGDPTLIALANNPHVRGLRKLVLNANMIGADGLRALLESPVANTLEVLALEGNAIDDRGFQALVDCDNLKNLQRLYVGGMETHDESAKTSEESAKKLKDAAKRLEEATKRLEESELAKRLDVLEARVARSFDGKWG
ncbi:MAG: TIGR02996 domain-containing protein, partial [Planctomycetales bacterium]